MDERENGAATSAASTSMDGDHYSRARKVAICVMATMEAFFMGIILFGWSSLVYVYQKEGIYADLCTHNVTHNG